ncbi:MAG: ABC transporter permease [Actinomycetota bacterium]|nr:ABC transporter permease [Actinomycetota bacterium]
MSALWPMYRRAAREALRVPLATFIVPIVVGVFMQTIFARVFSGLVQLEAFEGVAYNDYLLPGTLIMSVMLGSSTAGVSSAVELQTGFFDRMRISPLRELPSLRARRLADATRIGLYCTVLLFVGWIDGAHIESWPLAIAFAFLMPAAWCFAYGGLALAACLRTRSAETAQGMAPLFFPILFTSTAVMPGELLPGWLEAIATYNPVSYMTDAMRAGFAGDLDGGALGKAALGVAAVAALTQFLVVRARASLRAA